ncbi:7-cyano-7-deazaguanine synthase [Streptomyces sp. NPDC005077]|uniref:7-cyano-7-deazaguanine synthase n=1 Tax=Streptomyces sp. NPDC005077 TaxID=3154292 RepID=UPI0033A3B463
MKPRTGPRVFWHTPHISVLYRCKAAISRITLHHFCHRRAGAVVRKGHLHHAPDPHRRPRPERQLVADGLVDTEGAGRPYRLSAAGEVGLQRRVYESVNRLRGARPLMLLEMSQTPQGDGSGRKLEPSSRTRDLLYAAGAVRAAAAHGVDTVHVHVPENGQLALNPPLTPARAAACSTRSVHPWTLARLNVLVGAVAGPRRAVRVANPWAWMTKGEVCKAGSDAGLSPADLEATLSCGKSPTKYCRGPPNCGVCFPCLVRRSGLLYAHHADATVYQDKPWSTDVSVERRRNWRALQQWLLSPYTFSDVLTDIPLPPDTDPAAAFDLIMKGRGELTRLLGVASEDAAAVA